MDHWFKTSGPQPVWSFNGDRIRPTVSPSILVQYPRDGKENICHLFMKEGKLEYLTDCTHDMAGKIVDMVPEDDE